MPVKPRHLVLFALSYYLGLLLITAPASLLGNVLQHISDNRLTLANSQGTLWNGSAAPLLLNGKNPAIALQTFYWKLKPEALLQGQIRIDIRHDSAATAMELTLDRRSVTLTNIQLPLPASIISELSPFLKPVGFSGNLMLSSPQLTYADNQLQGQATARWNQAGSALAPIHPLGDYQLNLTTDNHSLQATLNTLSGALILDGQGNWSAAQGFHFNGTARAAEEAQPMLSELLHYLGPEVTPGVNGISL